MKSIYLVRGILSNMLNWRTRSFKYNVALREEIFSNQEVLNILSHIKKKYNKIDTLLQQHILTLSIFVKGIIHRGMIAEFQE